MSIMCHSWWNDPHYQIEVAIHRFHPTTVRSSRRPPDLACHPPQGRPLPISRARRDQTCQAIHRAEVPVPVPACLAVARVGDATRVAHPAESVCLRWRSERGVRR
jgi:hypothetical protein